MGEKYKNRWDYIDSLKLTVILIIVLNHSTQYKWNVYKVLSNDFQNPTMMFASGIVFSYCIVNLSKYETFKNLLQKKSKRLLVPLFLIAFLYYLPLIKLANLFIAYDEKYNRPLYKIALEYLMGVNLDQLWFVYALFIMYIIAYPIVKKTKIMYSIPGQVIFLVFTCMVNLVCYVWDPSYFCLGNIMRYAVFFAGGYIFNLHVDRLYEVNESQKRKIGLTAAVIIVMVIYVLDYKTTFLAGTTYTGGSMTAAIMSCLEIIKQFGMIYIICNIVRLLYDRTGFFKNSVVNYLVKHSFSIFLFHQPIVRLFLPIIHYLIKANNDAVCLLCSIITTCVAVIGALIVSKIVECMKKMCNRKPLLRFCVYIPTRIKDEINGVSHNETAK